MSGLADRYFDERLETLPPDLLRKLQDHRLRWQFRRCWDGSAWYRERFGAAGLSPETFGGLADLERLPLLDDLNLLNLDSAVWRVAPSDWIVATSHADGYADRRLTRGDIVHEWDREARARWSRGVVRPPRSLLSSEVSSSLHVRMGLPGSPHGDATSATLPARTKQGRDMRTLDLAFVGRTLGFECHELAGYHWAADHLMAEILDSGSGHPAPEGSHGELVVTDLVREASPLVRFRTGLEVRSVDEPCRCGRTSGRLLLAQEQA